MQFLYKGTDFSPALMSYNTTSTSPSTRYVVLYNRMLSLGLNCANLIIYPFLTLETVSSKNNDFDQQQFLLGKFTISG